MLPARKWIEMNKNEEVNLKKLTNFIGKQKQRYKLCKLWGSEISNLPLKHVRIVYKYFCNLHDCQNKYKQWETFTD